MMILTTARNKEYFLTFNSNLSINCSVSPFVSVLKVNRYLYDGTRRSPWNEIECGDHYARPMSSFSLFQTGSGQVKSYWHTTLSFG